MGGLPSIGADIPLDQAGTLAPSQGAAAPTSFFDKVKLGYQAAGAQTDWGWNQHNYEVSAYHDLRGELEAKGYKLPQTPSLSSGDEADFYSVGYHPTWGPALTGPQAHERFDAFWSAFNDARAHDPNFAPAYKDVHDFGSLLDHVHGARRSTVDDVAGQAPDGLGVAGFAGQLGRGAMDPMSWIPLGGPAVDAASTGGRILMHALSGAAINAGITTVLEPLVERDAAASGQQRSVGDFVTDLLSSSALGAGFGGIHAAASLIGPGIRAGSFAGAARQADADAFGKALKGAVERSDIPAGSPFASFDATVARAFAAATPRDQRTPDEQSAIDAIERNAEVKATSPFVPGPAGDDAHVKQLERGMNAIHNPDQLPQRGPVKPIDRSTIAGPDDVEGTRMPGRELFKAKIGAASGPEGWGKNPSSGADYQYQFVPSTWISLFKRRYPNDPRPNAEIVKLRADPHIRDVLINDLISENAAALRHAGFDESAGNLYLAHVLGHDRAVRVLSADPNARLGELLPDGYFKGNPFKPTDSAASLVHWAYGKMGDKSGLPAHIAAAPEAPEGAATIEAAETPETAIPTGRFDVEALYGDVGMTDRPVLNPDHFSSPEDHAASQLRFERASDAADGFAPVMSREEAFAPAEHFDALRRYRGTVTADAIGEALGLNPGEVQRAVASMQASDPNSPFVLTRGRQPKLAADGTVLREGTEPGRVIRRPPKPIKQNETMLEYLTRTNGGLNDVGGDLASMGAQHWHENAPFRRKLIDNEAGQSLDTAFERAIDAGYFPEHTGYRLGGNDAPDLQDFRDAIDDELRGKPRYSVDKVVDVHEAARRAEVDPEEEAAFHAAAEQHFAPKQMTDEEWSAATHGDETARPTLQREAANRGLEGVGDDVLADVYQRVVEGQPLDDAFADAIAASAARDLEDYAALTGEIGYEPSDDAATYIGEHPEVRGTDGVGGENGEGGRRPEAAAGGAEESRDQLAELAHDPEAGHFNDPVGQAAEAQADSTIHDLEMASAADNSGSYRLDEEGVESDLADILKEIDAAQKATDEMRACLKPKGGAE